MVPQGSAGLCGHLAQTLSKHQRCIAVFFYSEVFSRGWRKQWETGERECEEVGKTWDRLLGQGEWILASFHINHRLRCYSELQRQADPQLHRLPTHIAQNASVSLSLILHHLSSVLHQCRTSQLHNTVSFLSAEILSTPSLLTAPICLSILPSISLPYPVFRLYSASSTFFWWKLVM